MTMLGSVDFRNARVLVVGDVMLDRFVQGTVDRISPEAPIPVMRRTEERAVLGGAANVAANVATLGASAVLVGFVGEDPAGRDIARLCAGHGIEAGLVTMAQPTTEKVRFVGGGQQLLRVDNEVAGATAADQELLIAIARRWIGDVDVVVLSDYAKGACSHRTLEVVIAEAGRLGRPTIVDPKSTDFGLYRGATVLTPNRREAATATGIDPANDDAAERAGRRALDMAEATAVLVTRGAAGMTLVEAVRTTHLRSEAREVFDVSGAGDTVIATLALGVATGCQLPEASHVANVAAGIVVSKSGTATLTRSELLEALGGGRTPAPTVVSRSDASSIVAAWRANGFRVGFTNGCFDLLHPGHLHLLEEARAACDRLVVGLNSDSSVRSLKGPDRPIQPEDSRERILSSLRCVDLVVRFGEATPAELLKALRPDVLVKAADYRIEDVVGADFVMSYGGRVLLVDVLEDHSTTATVQKLRHGNRLTETETMLTGRAQEIHEHAEFE